jgi:hypothetical protein
MWRRLRRLFCRHSERVLVRREAKLHLQCINCFHETRLIQEG